MGRAALLILIVSLGGCSSKPRIVVGSKNFTEQVVLGEIIAGQIERRLGVEVERELNLGGTLLAHAALKDGSIDLYPEYTGTALTAVLKEPLDRDPKSSFQKVQQAYLPWHIVWLSPLGFNNGFAMVVRAADARDQHLSSLSDSAKHSWKMGVGYEFIQRPDGLKGLLSTYGIKLEGDPVIMDLGLLYGALNSKQINMAAANTTDGMLAHQEFSILDDDKHYFPPYECAIAVREKTLMAFPKLRAVLEELSGKLSDHEMRRLNELVDVQHKSPVDVARNFLSTIE
jgi:osmoprotectant transport system substrate-binding protein